MTPNSLRVIAARNASVGLTPHVVNHDLESLPRPASCTNASLSSFADCIEANDGVSAKLMQCAQGLLVAPRSDNATCAKKFCDLYSQLTGHAGRTENKYVFTGHQLGAEGKCEPSRRRRDWAGQRQCRHPLLQGPETRMPSARPCVVPSHRKGLGFHRRTPFARR